MFRSGSMCWATLSADNFEFLFLAHRALGVGLFAGTEHIVKEAYHLLGFFAGQSIINLFRVATSCDQTICPEAS